MDRIPIVDERRMPMDRTPIDAEQLMLSVSKSATAFKPGFPFELFLASCFYKSCNAGFIGLVQNGFEQFSAEPALELGLSGTEKQNNSTHDKGPTLKF